MEKIDKELMMELLEKLMDEMGGISASKLKKDEPTVMMKEEKIEEVPVEEVDDKLKEKVMGAMGSEESEEVEDEDDEVYLTPFEQRLKELKKKKKMEE